MIGGVRNARGGPLLALGGLALAWAGLRAMTWASPFPVFPALALPRPSAAQAAAMPMKALHDRGGVGRAPATALPLAFPPRLAPSTAPGPTHLAVRSWVKEAGGSAGTVGEIFRMAAPGGPAFAIRQSLPAGRRMAAAPVPIIPLNLAAGNVGAARWSLDSWLFVRERAAGLTSAGTTPANYGASQAGAVLRYRLALGSSLDPAAYVRVARALGSTHETEGAAGLSAVPVASIPIRLHGEVRLRHDRAGSTIAPSAFLTTELPPLPLPGRFRLEAYGQAGYVGGRYATGFADGQARIDRAMGTVGPLELRAGAGTWAGAQKGAARVDIGPTASTRIALGPASARLSVDYRIRVAGNAAPGSGVAVTLSAGF